MKADLMLKTVFAAKYVLVEPGILLEDSEVHVSDSGRILSVQRRTASTQPGVEMVDWGSAVIIPGLVNAHTHFELSSLRGRTSRNGSFTGWLAQVVAQNRARPDELSLEAARTGIRLALASGTTLAGDVTASGMAWNAAAERGGLRCIVFQEAIALASSAAGNAIAQLERSLDSSGNALLAHGISPHAPYTASAQLYLDAAALARRKGLLLSTHVAETKAELEFLQTGTGEFREFLSSLSALPGDWTPPGVSPIAYLDALGVMRQPCLLVHCNYLDEDAIAAIAARGSSVVYCPRSHAFFGHEDHPVRQLLDSGVNVALGTDSLASNDSLSILDEMRYLYKARRDITADEIFRAATVNGARALGFAELCALRPGRPADLTVLGLPQGIASNHLQEEILQGAGECTGTIVQGEVAWRKVQ